MRTAPKQAFVIWLDPAPPDASGVPYRGRIEHLASSTRERFSGPRELLAFIERALAATPAGGDPSDEDG